MITRWPTLTIAIVALTLFSIVTPRTATAAGASYMGNAACSGCHEQATADWAGSHHDLAMQEATPETVLGDFNDATFTYFGVTTTFSQKGDAFFIETDNAGGELETYPVEYVFGVEPLQQYLLPLGNGRLQALSVAWDTRPDSEGGQRWYHLYQTGSPPQLFQVLALLLLDRSMSHIVKLVPQSAWSAGGLSILEPCPQF